MENEAISEQALVVVDNIACLKSEYQKPRCEQDHDLIEYCIERMAREDYINRMVKGCYDSSLTEVIELLENKFRADQLVMSITLEAAKKEPDFVKNAIKRDFECRKALMGKIKQVREIREKLLNAIFKSDEIVMEDY